MISSKPLIHCLNSACSRPLNPISNKFCESCHTPLVYRYLWAADISAKLIPPGELVNERYQVIDSQIWLDTHPNLPPQVSDSLPQAIVPYLRLYPHCLHLPQVYGYATLSKGSTPGQVLLLENVPVDANGKLLPSIVQAWQEASPVRQVYWLWQILELWQPMAEQGVVSSLLVADNLRVEGWRVRLREFYADGVEDAIANPQNNSSTPTFIPGAVKPTLEQLGSSWESWFKTPHKQLEEPLTAIYQQMQAKDASYSAIASSLNQLLLEQAALLPLSCLVASATDAGPGKQHNEDSYYPKNDDISALKSSNGKTASHYNEQLISHLSIVCDGIGGHEGGEVASQLAVQSLKLQVQARLTEVVADPDIITPDIVSEQLAAVIRVANNLIAARNDEQGRESRRRMATTLVMALQLPQQVNTAKGVANSHELYIASLGDSRAYWITPQYCQQLTVDDDVATREVRSGKSIYRQALARPDAGALTQAMGIKDAEFLRPTVTRFIIEEDGLLLLCSDGVSDNRLVEQYLTDYAEPVLAGKISVESAVESLINLANQKNGHDNSSVVLSCCRVSPEEPIALKKRATTSLSAPVMVSADFVESANVYMDAELVTPEEVKPTDIAQERKGKISYGAALGLLILLICVGAFGLTTWWLLNPQKVEMIRDRNLKQEQSPQQSQPFNVE